MPQHEKEVFIGIDFNDSWTQISYFWPGMEEPKTVSTVVGEERYRIPTENYQGKDAREVLCGFLRRVIRMIPGLSDFSQIGAVTVHTREIDLEQVKLLRSIFQEIGVSREHVFLQDSKESFCHFVMNQKKELMQHDVVLFECEENELYCYYLRKTGKTRPVKVEIETIALGTLPGEPEARDLYFAREAQEVFKGKIVSAAYLTGDGLEGGWLNSSLTVLLRGRKAFQGKNLYTRGACYHSMLKMRKSDRSYAYFNENKLSDNLYLKVRQGSRFFFQELAEAGTNCYEVGSSCQVLLEGEPSVDVWIQAPDSKDARIVSLELTELPERPPKATRLEIEVVPAGKDQVMIRIRDLGFGPWYASSGKVWEYCINE